MEKKIAIVAPHRSMNYGTMLQAYALARVVNSFGYSCEYLSYSIYYKHSIFERIWNKMKRICRYAPKGAVRNEEVDDISFIFSTEFNPLLKKADNFYANFIPHSSRMYNPQNVWKTNFRYSKFIVGSDQSWSIENYIHEKAFYFLSFVFGYKKKYAYAPSIGTTRIPEQYKHILSRNLYSFRALSCREKSNSGTLSLLLNREVKYVIDPTLLIRKEEWGEFSETVSELPQKYILAYILGEKKCVVDFAERIAIQKGIPVYYVLTRPMYLSKPHVLKTLSPQQWIYAIANADCVVTDSFHGTLFSVNFNKEFYSFAKRKNDTSIEYNDNDRIIELLGSLHLEDRFIKDEDIENDSLVKSRITYERVNEIVENQRIESLNYLYKILND